MAILAPQRHNPTILGLDNSVMDVDDVQLNVPAQLNVICIYPPPTYSSKQFMHNLCRIISNIPDVPACVIGNVNEAMLQENEKSIQNTFLAFGFTQHSKTLLDTKILCWTIHVPAISGK